MNSRFFAGSVGFLLLSWAGLAGAQASRTLTEQEVVAAAVANNPTLHVALLRAQQNRYNLSAEEGLYTPLFDANAGYTRGRAPTLLGDDGVRIGQSDVATLGAGITKPFAYGTVLSATVTGQRSYRSIVATIAPDQTGMIPITATGSGPGYSLIGQLALTQPLLRGAGTGVGLASLRQAKLSLTASQLAAQQAASNLLSQVVVAYWELWYAGEVVRINEASRELARVQQEQAKQQVASGALAPASALPYATQLAVLEEAVLGAQTDVRQRELGLAQLLGQPGAVGDGLSAADAPSPPLADEPPLEQAVGEALRTSYERKQLQAQLAIVKDQLKIAGDPLRPRLDLDAYVQAQGLGNRSVPPAFEQVGRLDAVSAHVGLTFELPLSDSRRTAQVQAAQFSAHVTEQQLAENELAIRSGVASAIAQRRAARQRLELAGQTEKVARAQAEAERARFLAGGSIAITVQQAEDSYRQAQLRVQRARVDLMLAELSLTEQRGQLLSRYAEAVRRLPAEQRVTLSHDAAGNF
jgi:outer membrane protein